MKKSAFTFLLFIPFFLPSTAGADPAPTPSSTEIHLAIQKLNVLGSVLYLAAHPDDENTRLLAYYAKGRLLRTGYLSLNRGEGGQNLIGAEQGSLLGVIRTWELLRAREVDGAEQFFTRAVDFGYSKSPEESLAKWGKEQVLGDVTWVIRKFRPDVVITRFSPTAGGHGHHLASAILAQQALEAAADSTRFPEQLKHARPWKVRRMYWNAFRPQDRAPDSALIGLDMGTFNPVLGKSYAEIAALSRNNHKSQGFGTKPIRGAEIEKFKLTAGDSGTAGDLLAGVDLGWGKVKGGDRLTTLVNQALQAYDFKRPGEVMPILLQIRNRLARMPAEHWVDIKLKEADGIIAALMGLWVEATVESPSAVSGSALPLEVKAVVRALPGWTLENVAIPFRGDTLVKAPLTVNQPVTFKVPMAIPPDHPATRPYWLEGVLDSAGRNMYRVDDPALLGRPVAGPALEAEFTFKHKYGVAFTVKAPVEHAYLDKVRGEIFQPFVIAPAATATFAERVHLFRDGQPREVPVVIKNQGDSVKGEARLRLPEGWGSEPASQSFALQGRYAEEKVVFKVKPAAGDFRGRLGAELKVDGKTLDRGFAQLGYDHIPAQTLFPPAGAEAVKEDIRTGRERVGYITGAGDWVPASLRQLGYAVTVLGEGDLDGDLRRFDVLITGVRAHNTRKDLALRRGKIMDWVKAGGRLIVQYNVNTGLLTEEMGPFPFKLSRDRVTVEEAPLKLLEPGHPFFNSPNKLGPGDFENWIQERGLYFAGEWDARYRPLLEGNDPGEKPSRGILLVGTHGKGSFVYTGLSLFRQLPAGVPGAYRLLANLVSAKATDGK